MTEKSQVKRPNGAKCWAFTWNNYPEFWLAPLAPAFQGAKWIVGYEVGESGTPHLQGYVEFPIKVRAIGYKDAPKEIHWEVARASRSTNIEYCAKGGKVEPASTLKPPRPLPTIELWGWQLEAKKQLEGEPDARTIYWWCSEQGGMGKSSFVRYAVQNMGAIVCSGKAADMKYMIVKYKEKKDDYPRIVIFDVPRSSAKYISYTGMEEIKNGVFSSSKYETDMVCMPYPHVMVLCNFAPDMDNVDMSSDRFVAYDCAAWNADLERKPYVSPIEMEI